MSSSAHHPRDLDAPIYAPPWGHRGRTSSANAKQGSPAKNLRTSLYDADAPLFVGDRAILALQRQLSLDPEITPELPPKVGTRPQPGPMAVRLCLVGAIVALGAWGAMSLTSNPAGSDIVASPPLFTSVAAPARLADAAASGAPAVQTTVTPSAPSAASITDNGSPPQVGTAPLAVRQPEVSPIDAKASSLSPDEIAMLLKRGKADLTDGDISAARLLLQRAAEAGNAEAALALGSTFDPLMIARLDTFGMQADVAKARAWYQRAARLGSTLAAQQLANLARAGE